MAVKCALENGYGFESDVRDHLGCMVLSHNIADAHRAKVPRKHFNGYRNTVGMLHLHIVAAVLFKWKQLQMDGMREGSGT